MILGLLVLAGCAQRSGSADERAHDGFYGGVTGGRSSGDGAGSGL